MVGKNVNDGIALAKVDDGRIKKKKRSEN